MEINSDLIFKVNEVYHDVEGGEYELKHPEIFTEETDRWRRLGEQFFKTPKVIKILDIGTGTGFVPLQIGQFLKTSDEVFCADLSAKMLEIAESNISKSHFANKFYYYKINGDSFSLSSDSFDFIVLNSVLHHIPDVKIFLQEVNRLLKKGGLLIIGHEPNSLFFSNPVLFAVYIILFVFSRPKHTVKYLLKRLGLYKAVKKLYQKATADNPHEKIVAEVNRILIEQKVISQPFSADEITEIVDIHAPIEIEKIKDRGFAINKLQAEYLSNFAIEQSETYHHLKDLSFANAGLKFLDAWLKKTFPRQGSTFTVVFKKTKD